MKHKWAVYGEFYVFCGKKHLVRELLEKKAYYREIGVCLSVESPFGVSGKLETSKKSRFCEGDVCLKTQLEHEGFSL